MHATQWNDQEQKQRDKRVETKPEKPKSLFFILQADEIIVSRYKVPWNNTKNF